jgi:hypothetical protein
MSERFASNAVDRSHAADLVRKLLTGWAADGDAANQSNIRQEYSK